MFDDHDKMSGYLCSIKLFHLVNRVQGELFCTKYAIKLF